MKAFFTAILVVIAVLSIGFWLQYVWLINYSFFAPKYEAVRRDVYEQTPSYTEGKKQELLKYMLEYKRAKTENEKGAIKFTIQHEMSTVDTSKFDYDLQSFLNSL